MKSEARKKLEAKHAAEVQQLAAKHMAEAKAIIDEYERLHPGCFDEEAPEADEELALRAGQAGKAAFEAALAEGKSRKEANEIAIAAAQAMRDADEVEKPAPATYLHCSTCLAEFYGDVEQPADFPQEPTSPKEYARLNVGVTADGWVVVECVRHEQDVCRIHAPQTATFAAAPCCGEGHLRIPRHRDHPFRRIVIAHSARS